MKYFIFVPNKDSRKLTDYAKDLYYTFIEKYNYSENEIKWYLAKNGIEFQGVENILFDFQDYILDHMYEYGNYSYEDGDYELIEESARKSIKESSDESYLDEVRGFYFSNLDVGEECEVQFADFVMPCRISQFYKDHRYVYLIAETIHGEELYFVITYAYIRNKFVLSKYFSSYGKAKNELLNKISSVL